MNSVRLRRDTSFQPEPGFEEYLLPATWTVFVQSVSLTAWSILLIFFKFRTASRRLSSNSRRFKISTFIASALSEPRFPRYSKRTVFTSRYARYAYSPLPRFFQDMLPIGNAAIRLSYSWIKLSILSFSSFKTSIIILIAFPCLISLVIAYNIRQVRATTFCLT